MDDLPDRQTIRLKGYDYSQNGLYFCTICTHNRENIFGEIKNGEMILNENGKIVESVWKSLPKHHDVQLDCFQIMPNHVHLILNLTGGLKNKSGGFLLESGGSRPAPTLGLIIGFLKSESTKLIRKYVGATRGSPDGNAPHIWQKTQIWQCNFYDRIIRDESEYDKICYYITHNPEMWDRDRNNLNPV